MAIKYKVIEQPPSKLSVTNKPTYNARACKRYKASLKDIAEAIQRRSSLTKAEVYGVLISLTDIIPDLLLDNKSVDLGDLGTISLHLSSKSEDKPEDVSWRSIKELKVKFRASVELKKNLKEAHFKRVD